MVTVAQPVFTWEAAVAIAYTALWNIGLYLFNTRNPLWKRCSHVNVVLVSHKKQDCPPGPPQTWLAWDNVCAKDVVSFSRNASCTLSAFLEGVLIPSRRY
jgi:hypothetical protein